MFKNLRSSEPKNLNHNGRSHIGETLQIEGDLRSSGSVDVAGLINGNVFVSDIVVKESGSVRGALESTNIEINGIKGSLRIKGIFIIYVATYFEWLNDNSESLDKTMTALDKNLDKFSKILNYI